MNKEHRFLKAIAEAALEIYDRVHPYSKGEVYFRYGLWENYGKKRAYFQAIETGHRFSGDKEKPLRRTDFYYDFLKKEIVGPCLYSNLKDILRIEITGESE